MSTPVQSRGFTLFELSVAVIVVGIISALLLNRLQDYQLEAERVAVRQLVGTLRTALSARSAELGVVKKEQSLLDIIGENPIHWLVHPPANYVGEFYSPEEGRVPRGSWYFDRASRELVYLAQDEKTFGTGHPILLRFKVKFLALPLPPGKHSGLPAKHEAVVLDQVADQNVVN